MIILQLILSIIIPAVLVIGGRRYIRNLPAYGEKRFFRFHSRRAAASEEAWHFANNLYAHMLYTSGLSIGVITVVFFLVASHYTSHTWIMCISLIVVQIAGSIVLPAAVADFMLRRTYDKNGELIENDQDDEPDENNAEGNKNESEAASAGQDEEDRGQSEPDDNGDEFSADAERD